MPASERAAHAADFLAGQIADEGFSLLDEFDRPVVHLLKIVGCEVEAIVPIPSQPANVVLTLVKDGDHRLSRAEDIERLIKAVAEF